MSRNASTYCGVSYSLSCYYDMEEQMDEQRERFDRARSAARDALASVIYEARHRCGPVAHWDSWAQVSVARARQRFAYLKRHDFTDPSDL